MQPDEFTLAVDTENTDVTTDVVYTKFDKSQNYSIYHLPNHTLSSRDMLGMYRSFPKQSGNFRGTAKSAVKYTKDITIPGVDSLDLVAPLIVEVSFSIPVGATVAQCIEMRQRTIALLDNDLIMNSLNSELMI